MTPGGTHPGEDAAAAPAAFDDEAIPTKEELAARSAGFRWPPLHDNPPDALPRAAATLGAGADIDLARGAGAPVDYETVDYEEGEAGPPRAPASAWGAIEDVWLDLVAPPLPRRMAQLGWAPDPPEAYCHRCGATVGPYEATEAGCTACESRRLPWRRLVRLGEYRPPLSLFVQEVKFTGWRRLGRELGQLLAGAVGHALEAAGRDPDGALVVPVPTTFRRRMVRGIDHTHVLAAAVARTLRVPLRQPLRRRHRPSQLDVLPSDRASNVSGTMRLGRPRRLARAIQAGAGGTIVVVDDVTTTGATLRATCRALQQGLRGVPAAERPHIWTAVLCWTPPAGGPQRRAPMDAVEAERRVSESGVWT